MSKFSLAVSLLASAPEKYDEFITNLRKYQDDIDIIHFDIMDGSFVANKSFGPEILKFNRHKSNLRFDAHLMVNNPEIYLEKLVESGVDSIIFHYEATKNIRELIQKIRHLSKKIGIAINPQTKINEIFKYLSEIDLLLIMTVEPGACGQKFIEKKLQDIKLVKKYINNHQLSCQIQIDGGINFVNSSSSLKAGADSIVSGSYLVQNSQINEINLRKIVALRSSI